jgi:hypothetical protein
LFFIHGVLGNSYHKSFRARPGVRLGSHGRRILHRSADLHIQTIGANQAKIDIPNVLFIGSKIALIRKMISEKPD